MLFFLLRSQFIFFILTAIISSISIAQEGLDLEEFDINESFIEAMTRGDAQGVQALLNQGAYVDTLDQSGQFTALMTAIRENHIEVAKILLEAGADINFKNKADVTPLMVASNDIVPGRNVIVLELLKRGAHMYIRNADGNAPIDIAIESQTRITRRFATIDPEQLHTIPIFEIGRAHLDVINLFVLKRNGMSLPARLNAE